MRLFAYAGSTSVWTGASQPSRLARSQHYFGARLIRFAHLLCRRLATVLAVVAAFAFVAEAALGAHHHLPAAVGGHVHAHGHSHSHSHRAGSASDHQLLTGDAVDGVNIAAPHHDT